MAEKGIYEKVPESGQWYIRWADPSGTIRREKAGTLAVARKLLIKRRNESQVERKLPSLCRKRTLFSELVKDALVYSKRHSGAATHYNNGLRAKKLLAAFSQKFADAVLGQDIERWLSANTKTPATNNRYHATLSLIFRLAEQNQKIERNPMRGVKKLREAEGKLRFLTGSEESKLREYIMANWPHHWPAVELALNTGMRRGEQFSLKWEQVDWKRRQITLSKTKNGRVRYVPLNDSALAALRSAQSLSNDQPWVFLNCYGEQHISPRTWFEKAIAETKIKGVTWHTLRHTFASRLAMSGGDIIAIKELLGHSTIQMTMRYAHLSPDHKLSTVQLLCNTVHNVTDPRTDTGLTVDYATEAGAVN